LLLAANFRSGRVDVFDGTFAPVPDTGRFTDPTLPRGYAPFNVAEIDGRVFVTYALRDAAGEDDVAGPAHGFVNVFTSAGALVKRFASHGVLNSPWGMTIAPTTFGQFAGDLLIGNFGDGRINVLTPAFRGGFLPIGQLRTQGNHVLAIDGLWALQFGKNTPNNGPATTLFFTAGPDGESHGLFGKITSQP
jgi:uncharacterized protein (TIGR03118 family)